MSWINEVRQKLATGQARQIDADSQPLNVAYRSQAVANRQVDELIGIVKGVMADGMVHQGEVEFLLLWMQSNRGALDKWPAKAIYPRLVAALADGRIDLDEEREIMDLLLAVVGGNTAPMSNEASDSTTLPYTKPLPIITFPERNFCFTGKFQSGTRQWCETQVISKGGMALGSITKKLHYLVIGEIGSRDWLHSTYGAKIEKAIEYNETGTNILILGEEHWFEQVAQA